MDAWVGQAIVGVAVLVMIAAAIRLWSRRLGNRRPSRHRGRRGAPDSGWQDVYRGAGIYGVGWGSDAGPGAGGGSDGGGGDGGGGDGCG